MKHPKFETTPEVSKRMSRVHLKRGIAETMLAKSLWHNGVRYQYNYKKLPGSPFLVITTYHIAIFVDGEFWLGKDWEKRKPRLKSNRDYWIEKIEENMARDERNNLELRSLGWNVIRFWEKDVKKNVDGCVSEIIQTIAGMTILEVPPFLSDGFE